MCGSEDECSVLNCGMVEDLRVLQELLQELLQADTEAMEGLPRVLWLVVGMDMSGLRVGSAIKLFGTVVAREIHWRRLALRSRILS